MPHLSRNQILCLLLALALAGGAGFVGGRAYERQAIQANYRGILVPASVEKDFQLLLDSWQTIQQNYVDRSAIDNTQLTYGAISGMVDALGDTGHSRFLPPQSTIAQNAASGGQSESKAAAADTSITWCLLPGTSIADIRIPNFFSGITDQLVKALGEIQSQGAKGLILDLRDNPGGVVYEAVGAASQFLKDGDVLQEVNAQGMSQNFPVISGGLATDIPLVVLVNHQTASAAEIVSGALQDAGRARLVGDTTFGTGTVLVQFPLPDQSALLLATEEWLTPNGQSFWHRGLSPDEPVTLAAGAKALFPQEAQGMSAGELKASADAQLLQAINDLKN